MSKIKCYTARVTRYYDKPIKFLKNIFDISDGETIEAIELCGERLVIITSETILNERRISRIKQVGGVGGVGGL